MSEYDWSTTRSRAIEAFGGQTPGAQLEAEVIDVFKHHPSLVERAIAKVADAWRAGKATSPWAVLRIELQRSTSPTQDVHVTDSADRQRALLRAEQRVRAELIHYDRWSEAHDELFGDRGPLRQWPDLATRLEELWTKHRPDGERVEREAEERAAKHIADQQRVSQAVAAKKAELDQAQADQAQAEAPA